MSKLQERTRAVCSVVVARNVMVETAPKVRARCYPQRQKAAAESWRLGGERGGNAYWRRRDPVEVNGAFSRWFQDLLASRSVDRSAV